MPLPGKNRFVEDRSRIGGFVASLLDTLAIRSQRLNVKSHLIISTQIKDHQKDLLTLVSLIVDESAMEAGAD